LIRRPRRLLLFVLATAALAIAVPVALASTTVISLSGSTAAFPLIELLTSKYSALQHHKVKFIVAQGGSTVGINDAASGKVNIGNASAGPTSTTPGGLDFYPIAKYFVCVVTNPSNPISNLTTAQVESIFEGKVTNWSQVSGSSLTTPIDVESRTSVAGVLTTFASTLLGGAKSTVVTSAATQWASEGELQSKVAGDPNAIGFLSDYFALNKKKVNAVAYNGIGCNVADTVNETYPGWSFFYEVTRGTATGTPEGRFINWIQTSKPAKKIIETNWIPLTITAPTSG
jgi:phosphate transport system substrate-binding protein